MATSTSHEVPFSSSSSSSSSSRRWKYDVFVSFRGKDTRKGFTGHLYMALNGAGIKVFGDDDQLRRGTVIEQELMQAIKGSKISVIVFSRSYGDSIWCLEELVEILECRKRWGQMVLPIFYDVDPSDVRNQTGSFGEAFDQKLQDKDKYQIQRWRDALTEAANLSGWELRKIADGHEAKFIKKIADEIKKISVEMDSRLQDLSSCLREELTDDVHMNGISGMKGTGKTTNGKSTTDAKSYHGLQSEDRFLENVIPVNQNESASSERQNEGESEFTSADSVSDIIVKRACVHVHSTEISFSESLISFKEESNIVADLSDSERKALQELKQLVQEALITRQFTSPKRQVQDTQKKPATDTSQLAISSEEVSIWGVPLLKDDRSDVILQKFLRARDFKVKYAFVMLRNMIQWRREFGIDALVNEDLGDDLEKVLFMHGYDREGHPVCYNVFGEFQNEELYQKTFSDEEKRTKFLRWWVQFVERCIRKLDFRPGGVCTTFQVNDLKNSPGPAKSELRLATLQALQLLQDNYPEFVAKQVFINTPWWNRAFLTMISPLLTQRTKSKFGFASPAKSAETLSKYISAEHVPIQYGGLSVDYCDYNPDFTIADPVTEVTIKPGTKKTVEIIIYEKCTIVWEFRVVGWEVRYRAEFVPDSQDFTLIIQKATKMAPTDQPVLHHRFKVGELGKILLTIGNPTSRKKRLLYRFKIEPSYTN